MSNYEFTADQNKVIAELAKNVSFVGKAILICILITVIGFMFNFSQNIVVLLLDFLVWIFIGGWHFRASKALMKIVDTEGNDIEHLMKAMKSFSAFYFLYYWAFLFWVLSVAFSSILTVSN